MNPIPYLIFAVVFFLWFVGFQIKQTREGDYRKADEEWKKGVLDTSKKMEEHLDLLEQGKRNEHSV